MTNTHPVLGIDISKERFDVCLITASGAKEKYRKFRNNESGFAELSTFLARHGVVKTHACMESTGHYGDKLALWLHKSEHIVSIVNPYRIKGFAISELQRSKTDKIDAGVIARFCLVLNPAAWSPRAQELDDLQTIGRYVDALKQSLVQEQNRFQSGFDNSHIGAAIEQHMRFLRNQIAELERRMRQIVRDHERLETAFACATSIVGIGEVAAFCFLGEIGYGDQFQSGRQVEAFCGVNPQQRTSGDSINGKARLSKMGNSRMRKALYMPAMSAIQHNPAIRDFANRLAKAGKSPKTIIGAVMRKLLRLMFAVVTSKRPYDAEYMRPVRHLSG